jgi:dTDP-D-glucose 4,6-dehydratase
MHKDKAGEIENVGADNQLANIHPAKKILSLLGKAEKLLTSVKDRPGHDRRYAIASKKLQARLGSASSIDFDKWLARTVAHYCHAAGTLGPFPAYCHQPYRDQTETSSSRHQGSLQADRAGPCLGHPETSLHDDRLHSIPLHSPP